MTVAYFVCDGYGGGVRALTYEWDDKPGYVQCDYSTAHEPRKSELMTASTWTPEWAEREYPLKRPRDGGSGWTRVSRCDFRRYLKTNGFKS